MDRVNVFKATAEAALIPVIFNLFSVLLYTGLRVLTPSSNDGLDDRSSSFVCSPNLNNLESSLFQ
jgi:hypothetical protein